MDNQMFVYEVTFFLKMEDFSSCIADDAQILAEDFVSAIVKAESLLVEKQETAICDGVWRLTGIVELYRITQ